MAILDSHNITCSLNTTTSSQKLKRSPNLLQICLLCSSLHKFSLLISNQPTLIHIVFKLEITAICSCLAQTVQWAPISHSCEGREKAGMRTMNIVFKKWKKKANLHASFLKLDFQSKNLPLLGKKFCWVSHPPKRQTLQYWDDLQQGSQFPLLQYSWDSKIQSQLVFSHSTY